MEENQLKTMSVIALAYMGDVLYEVRVREMILKHTPGEKVRRLHQAAVRFVCAAAQAKAVKELITEGFLTEEEQDLVRRGRNQAAHPTKNADPNDYRYATGFEALLGWLFFRSKIDRMNEIIDQAIDCLKKT